MQYVLHLTIYSSLYNGMIDICWIMTSLFQIFDAGEAFSLAKVEQEDSIIDSPKEWFKSWKVLVSSPEGIKSDDPKQYDSQHLFP